MSFIEGFKHMSAEQIVNYIASDMIELSYEKVINQRDTWAKICKQHVQKGDE